MKQTGAGTLLYQLALSGVTDATWSPCTGEAVLVDFNATEHSLDPSTGITSPVQTVFSPLAAPASIVIRPAASVSRPEGRVGPTGLPKTGVKTGVSTQNAERSKKKGRAISVKYLRSSSSSPPATSGESKNALGTNTKGGAARRNS